jgi:hypothetical protein
MNLEIIVRTHDQSNVHTFSERYCGADKKTLILKCLTSLINSTNRVQGHGIRFKILDDHSSEGFIEELHKLFGHSIWEYELYRMKEKGFNYSAVKQFEYCKDSEADLIYSVEDDYLHSPDAIQDMIDNFTLFTEKSGLDVCIFPFDMPDNYVPPWMEYCMVVHGTKEHWRTTAWTTNTFMTKPKVLIENWPVFYKLASEYNPDYSDPNVKHVDEGNTICDIWRKKVLTFSPIKSLALHMQFEQQKDPYIDWQYWWENYTILNN